MSTFEMTAALPSLLSLAGIWILLFWLYRDYCVDKFRQDMFAIRDELFDAARSGQLRFDHPAYGVLRSTMNGFIRFAHRFTLLQALLMVAIAKESIELETSDSFPIRWKTAIADLDGEALKLMTRYRLRMNLLVIRYVLVSSPILLLTLVVPLAGWLALRLWMSQLLNALRAPLDGLDSAAMAEGQA